VKLARSLLLRLFYGVISVFFVVLVTFFAAELAPGDVAEQLAGEKASLETIERIRANLGLDQPWPIRLGIYVQNVVTGDLGNSFYGAREPVLKVVTEGLAMTAQVAIFALLFAASIGVFLGSMAAVKENTWLDKVILTVGTFGVTVPNFVLAPLLVYLFAVQLDLLPQTWTVNRVAPDWVYLLLPMIVLAGRPCAMLIRLMRTSMIETLRNDYIVLAVAKGVPKMALYFKHALRNALLPVITAIGSSFGILLTGSFVVERFFNIPGIGRATIEAIQQRDTPVILGCILATGILFVLVNLVVDLLIPILDPRIRGGGL
jgi:ABC-type dipeptide/oligopeptide/nickel transport system permease component